MGKRSKKAVSVEIEKSVPGTVPPTVSDPAMWSYTLGLPTEHSALLHWKHTEGDWQWCVPRGTASKQCEECQ